MKKIFTLLLSFVMVLTISVSTSTVKANILNTNDSFDGSTSNLLSTGDKEQLLSLTQNYFTSEIESIKQNRAITIDDNLMSTELKEYSSLKNLYLSDWFKEVDKELINYSVDLNFKDLEVYDESLSIICTVTNKMVFKDSPEIEQLGQDDYKILFKKLDENLILEDVILLEESEFNQKSLLRSPADTRYETLKSKYLNLKKDAQRIKELSVSEDSDLLNPENTFNARSYSSGYLAAIDYAHTWALGRNPAYRDFGDNDCTNFVSQCVFAGGMPMVEPKWAYSSFTQSRSWVLVTEFWTAMYQLGYGTPNSSAYRGDIVQFYNSTKKEWSHAGIITAKDSYATLFYSAHSSNRRDYGLYNVYPSSLYTDVRFLGMNY